MVGPRSSLLKHRLHLYDLNWLGDEELGDEPVPVFARIRSTRAPVAAEAVMRSEVAAVHIFDGEYAISPGQACVLYERPGPGACVFGGGFIMRSDPGTQARRLPESVSAAK